MLLTTGEGLKKIRHTSLGTSCSSVLRVIAVFHEQAITVTIKQAGFVTHTVEIIEDDIALAWAEEGQAVGGFCTGMVGHAAENVRILQIPVVVTDGVPSAGVVKL